MDPQFGLTIDRVTALALYRYFEHEYISPTNHPEVSALIPKLRAFHEIYTQPAAEAKAEVQ